MTASKLRCCEHYKYFTLFLVKIIAAAASRVQGPDGDWWRSGMLLKLLEMRGTSGDQDKLNKMIDSLCTT